MKNLVSHINIPTSQGKIFCKKNNEIVDSKEILKQCKSCKYFSGTGQGQGIECVWKDSIYKDTVVKVQSPISEYCRLNLRNI